MHSKQPFRNLLCGTIWCATTATAVLAIVFMLTIVAIPATQAQTFTVLHNFTGGQDGAFPYAGLTMDKAGHLYGTTNGGGAGYGTVYELKHIGQGWVLSPLHAFAGGSDDGAYPWFGALVFGTDGAVYGTALKGGNDDWGTVFSLKPSSTACESTLCPWTENVLYRFNFYDGAGPCGELAFDQAGNIYGTTNSGGNIRGLVYELTPSGTLSVLHVFTGNGEDGEYPSGGVIFDSAGNLWGTTGISVFELMPGESGWTYKQVLWGVGPDYAGLIFDKSGNLYGATAGGGTGGYGSVFEGGTVLYSFTGGGYDGGPYASLIMDAYGTLYGTTKSDGAYGYGSVFMLSPQPPTPWGPPRPNRTYITLHDFTGGSDGAYPYSNVIFDANGNLYGTASGGGTRGGGVVWEITP